MILRLFAAAVLVYAFGFLAFAVSLPKPVSGQRTDAVIVLTGGPGRIARGLEVVEASCGMGASMLSNSVHPLAPVLSGLPAAGACHLHRRRRMAGC